MSKFASLLFGVGTAVAAAGLVAGAAAQTSAAIPDFTDSWIGPNGGTFAAAPGSPASPTTNDPAHPYINNVVAARTGQQPNYHMGDISNPNIKQWAKDVMKKDNDEILAGKIAYSPGQSCKPYGVPAFWLSGGPFYFMQTAKKVTIIQEGDNLARQIYLNVPHTPNLKPSWYGESVGHFEGDTLVVDTVGQNAETFVDNYRTPHTEKLHVVERFRKIEGGKTLEVQITVEDPDTFNQKWQAVRRFRHHDEPIGEDICQEGNFVLFDYGIPVADKPDF